MAALLPQMVCRGVSAGAPMTEGSSQLALGQQRQLCHRLLAGILMAFLGVAISILPHWAWWSQAGEPLWFADNDDLLYLASASQTLHHGGWTLQDPAVAHAGPIMYPSLQMVPGVWVTKALGLPPQRLNFVWRV